VFRVPHRKEEDSPRKKLGPMVSKIEEKEGEGDSDVFPAYGNFKSSEELDKALLKLKVSMKRYCIQRD
jgi:hypothetical protein